MPERSGVPGIKTSSFPASRLEILLYRIIPMINAVLAFQPQLIIEDLSGKNLWAHGCHLPSPTSGSGTSITISPLAGTCLCLRLWAMIKTAAWLIGFLPPFRGNRLFPCCQQEIVGENHQPGPSTMTVPSGPRKNNPDGRSCWGNAES